MGDLRQWDVVVSCGEKNNWQQLESKGNNHKVEVNMRQIKSIECLNKRNSVYYINTPHNAPIPAVYLLLWGHSHGQKKGKLQQRINYMSPFPTKSEMLNWWQACHKSHFSTVDWLPLWPLFCCTTSASLIISPVHLFSINACNSIPACDSPLFPLLAWLHSNAFRLSRSPERVPRQCRSREPVCYTYGGFLTPSLVRTVALIISGALYFTAILPFLMIKSAHIIKKEIEKHPCISLGGDERIIVFDLLQRTGKMRLFEAA